MAATRDVGRAKTDVEKDAARPHDVFLSHSSEDKAAVEQVARGLKRSGVKPWLDKWEIAPGARWQDELAAALRSVRACAVFVGPAGIGDWEQQELGLALDRAAKEPSFRVFPVLLPGVADPFDPTSLPPFLSTRSWVDMRAGTGDPDALDELVRAVTGSARRVAPEGQATILNPYVGLRAYDADDALFFFGRAGDTQVLLERLKAARFLAVLGPSGSGKSSLVRAGLIPALKDDGLPGSGSWRVEVIRPGAEPLTALAARLTDLFPKRAVNTTLDSLAADHRSLHLLVAASMSRAAEGERVLWMVDQFEEVFTTCRNEPERASFIANLLYAAAAPQGRNVIVTTMRADFYPHCAEFPELARAVASHQYLVPQLTAEGFAQVIERPAAVAGLELVEGLTDALLRDVVDQPGGLPLLQHTLFELWRRRTGKVLTLDSYRDLGGVAGSLARAAEEIYEALSEEQRDIARRTFLRLTQPGEGTEDTRRRARLEELSSSAELTSEIDEVVSRFTGARLLTTDLDEHGRPTLEVAHEALLRGWPRLRRWLDDGRAALVIHRRLTEAVHEWEAHDRHPDFLIAGTRLAEAEELAESDPEAMNDLERSFLDSSIAARTDADRRRKRRLRLTIASLTAGLAIVALLGAIAGARGREAARQRSLAEARELANAAATQVEIDPQLTILLALESLDRAVTPEGEAALRQGLLGNHLLHVLTPRDDPDEYAWEVTLSPDGAYAATGTPDNGGIVRIWDMTSGREVHTLKFESGSEDNEIHRLSFSPRGELVAAGSSDGLIGIWTVADGALQRTFKAHEGGNWTRLEWNPNGPDIATALGGVKVWNATTGKVLLDYPHEGLDNVMYSQDGTLLVGTGKAIRIWRTTDWSLISSGKIESGVCGFTSPGSVDRHNRLVALAGCQNEIHIWDIESARVTKNLAFDSLPIAAAFSPTENLLVATELADPSVRVWAATTWKRAGAFEGHRDAAMGMEFSDDGTKLATIGADSLSVIWEVANRRPWAFLRGASGTMQSIDITGDGRTVAVGGPNGGAHVWRVGQLSQQVVAPDDQFSTDFELDSERELLIINAPRGVTLYDSSTGKRLSRVKIEQATMTVLLADSGAALTTVYGGNTFLWDVDEPGEKPKEIKTSVDCDGLRCGTYGAALSPDGTHLVSADADDTARVVEIETSEVKQEISKGHTFINEGIAWSPLNKLIVPYDDQLAILDPDTGQAEHAHTIVATRTWTHAFDGTGRIVVMGSWDGFARVLDTVTGDLMAELRSPQKVTGVAITPEARFVATATGTAPVLWSVESRRMLASFPGHGAEVRDVEFGPDGEIYSLSEDGEIRVSTCAYCGPLDELIDAAREVLVRDLTLAERRQYGLTRAG